MYDEQSQVAIACEHASVWVGLLPFDGAINPFTQLSFCNDRHVISPPYRVCITVLEHAASRSQRACARSVHALSIAAVLELERDDEQPTAARKLNAKRVRYIGRARTLHEPCPRSRCTLANPRRGRREQTPR